MTANQIAYWRNVETQRSNLERESHNRDLLSWDAYFRGLRQDLDEDRLRWDKSYGTRRLELDESLSSLNLARMFQAMGDPAYWIGYAGSSAKDAIGKEGAMKLDPVTKQIEVDTDSPVVDYLVDAVFEPYNKLQRYEDWAGNRGIGWYPIDDLLFYMFGITPHVPGQNY